MSRANTTSEALAAMGIVFCTICGHAHRPGQCRITQTHHDATQGDAPSAVSAQGGDRQNAVAVAKRAKHGRTEYEYELQRECEKMLLGRGYMRLTSQRVVDAASFGCPRGFFGHWTENEGQPFMPDLAVFGFRRRPLLVELKTRNKWQPGQKAAINIGLWDGVAWTVDEFRAMLDKWENEA